MSGYITGFSVYTLAMIGVIFVALVIVKKCLTFSSHKNKNNFLKVENCLNIEPRKNLYVVKAGTERFLIASSGENCNFMTKLESGGNNPAVNDYKTKYYRDYNYPEDIPDIETLKNKAGSNFTGIF